MDEDDFWTTPILMYGLESLVDKPLEWFKKTYPAIYIPLGISIDVERVVEELEKVFGDFPSVWYPCECRSAGPATFAPLNRAIIHLNDHHKWTREQIADWLDTLDIDLTIKAAK